VSGHRGGSILAWIWEYNGRYDGGEGKIERKWILNKEVVRGASVARVVRHQRTAPKEHQLVSQVT